MKRLLPKIDCSVPNSFITVLLLLLSSHLFAQAPNLIAQFEFDGTDILQFTSVMTDRDCEANPSTPGVFGIENGAFVIRDVEAENQNNCCPCAFGGGPAECGPNDNIAQTFVTVTPGFF